MLKVIILQYLLLLFYHYHVLIIFIVINYYLNLAYNSYFKFDQFFNNHLSIKNPFKFL